MDKGISPLVASVILIALVVGIASMLSPWVKTFFKKRMGQTEEVSKGRISCTNAQPVFNLDDIHYNLTGANDSVNITLRNRGRVELYNFIVSLLIDGSSYSFEPKKERDSSNPLKPGLETTLRVDITENLEGTLRRVRVMAQNCPAYGIRECDLVEKECK